MTKQLEFECQFCSKNFVKESSLIAHSCVRKMRWLDKDNKNVIVGFSAWKRFYQLTKSNGKNKTYKDFVESKFYNDFINFGKWINDNSILEPNSYIDYLIKGNFKLKDWKKNSIYDTYLRTLLVKENPADALERTIVNIQNWCKEQNIDIDKFFETISSNRLVDMLRSGKISPWIIFTSSSPEKIFDRFDSSQIKLLDNILEPKIWNLKLNRHKKDLPEYKELMRSLGL